jgi:hypothetical protein
MHEILSVYRHHNLRSRRSDARPKAFENLPEILIPEFEEEQFASTVEPREMNGDANVLIAENHNGNDFGDELAMPPSVGLLEMK